MLKRKDNKLGNGAEHNGHGDQRPGVGKIGRPRRRFIISSKAHGHVGAKAELTRNGESKAHPAEQAKAAYASSRRVPAPGAPRPAVDLTETIKALLHLAREHGHVTYDDINDILPDNLSPDDLDELYTKLRSLDVEIVDQAEVERPKPAQPEEADEDARLEVLDDPVRMYMNQMGKVPLLTREQEVEICKRIEVAESEMKRLVYSLGFTAKEHIAIAEKLLSDPPKERFDRIVVDKKVASREGHLKHLRRLVRKIQMLDAEVDEQYTQWRKAASAGRREKLFARFQKLDRKLQGDFPKFFYKQKVLEDMILVASNIHQKFQAGLRRIQELEEQRKSSSQQ